jgi:signal transduction histidine kinase
VENPYPEFRRKRILWLYALAILIPGVLLGYMAYQGIVNDQARREKESRVRLEEISNSFFGAMDSLLVSMVTARDPADPAPGWPGYVSLAYSRRDPGDFRFGVHSLIYLPNSPIGVTWIPEEPSADFIQATMLEQNPARMDSALASFRRIAASSKRQDEVLLSLYSIARIRKKQNDASGALDTWDEITHRFPDARLQGTTPVLLTAFTEKTKLYEALGDRQGLRVSLGQLYDALANPVQEYGPSVYRFFRDEADHLANRFPVGMDSLRRLLDRRQQESEFFLRLISEPDLMLYSRPATLRRGWSGLNHMVFEQDGIPYLFLSRLQPGGQTSGICIDLKGFIRTETPELFNAINGSPSISWHITGNAADTLASGPQQEGNAFIGFEFPDPYPAWTLMLRENRSGSIAGWFEQGTGMFVLVFLFIVLIMAMGLIFTIYALNQELKLNRLKSDFISNVSHELKSPLTSIRHLADLLHRSRVRSEEQKATYYSTMLRQTEHLSYLIDNILDFSRLESDRKKYRFEEVNLTEQVQEWLDTFNFQNPDSRIVIEAHLDPTGQHPAIDIHAMQQVFNNLLDNAIKYSGTSTHVEVGLREEDHEIVLSVRDHGIGIPARELDRIFERFYRCRESRELGIRGSGIGLTIVQRIVHAHGGRIRVESVHGEGSLFSIHLPKKSA